MNRREFVVMGAGAAAVVLGSRVVGQPQPKKEEMFFEWKSVSGPVTVAFGMGGNSTRVVGKEVTYLFDTKNSPWGKTLRREVGTGAPKLVVINTHHHADHTGGNHAFTPDCTVMAHEKCLPRIPGNVARYISQIKEAVGSFPKDKGPAGEKARADWMEVYKHVTELEAKQFTPTKGVGDSLDLGEAGGAKIQLRQFGPGHTDNDLVAFLPEENVLVAGDLLFRKLYPYVDPDGGGTVAGWIAALGKAAALCDAKTKVVPGHGEITDVSGLKEQTAYFEKCREAVEKALKAGRERKDIVTMRVPFPGYQNEDRQSMTMAALYGELKGGEEKK
jgi:cyclase